MRIKTRLNLNSYISIGVVLLIILSLIWSFREVSKADQSQLLITRMMEIAFETRSLKDEYMVYREERPLIQWKGKAVDLRELLDLARRRLIKNEERALLSEIQKVFDSTVVIFSILAERSESGKGVLKERERFSEGEQRLFSQLLLKEYALRDGIGRLQESVLRTSQVADERLILVLVLLIVATTLTTIGNVALINRILTKGVSGLRRGAESIGSGDLDHRIEMKGDDELCDLARTTNEMAAKLKESYTSVENLRKELEQRVIQRTAQLEAANKELEAFSYSVSHDLRAPLRSIDGFSQVLLEDYGNKLEGEGREALQRVRNGAQRMAQLIDDLFKLSRVTRGEMRQEMVDLSSMAKAALTEFQKTEPERRVECVVTEGAIANGNGRLLWVVLENLLGNAWKFTAKRSQAKIEFGITQRDGKTAYFVRDNGVGFDMAYSDKLFGAFQRLHSMTEYPGTGIGLATVQRIVHRHGGEVWAEGVVDQGATFYFTLP